LNISAFGEDEDGELFVVSYADGTIRRLADVNGPGPDLSSYFPIILKGFSN